MTSRAEACVASTALIVEAARCRSCDSSPVSTSRPSLMMVRSLNGSRPEVGSSRINSRVRAAKAATSAFLDHRL